MSRRLVLCSAAFLAVVATVIGAALYNELRAVDKLPVYDQAMYDNRPQIDLGNPAEKALVDAGYGPLEIKYVYTDVRNGQPIMVRAWYGGNGTSTAPQFFYTLGGKIVGVQIIRDGVRCDVSVDSQEPRLIASDLSMYVEQQQRRASTGVYSPNDPDFSVHRDGNKITYYCN